MKFFSSLVIVALLVAFVSAHSWVACTDYQPTNRDNSRYYRGDRCKGYPRNWENYNNGIFGAADKKGYHHQAKGCGPKQRMSNPRSSAYSNRYPMAKWNVGQTKCLAWPSKNHVATRRTLGMPDRQLRLFRSGPNNSKDPSQNEFKKHQVVQFGPHVHMTVDYKGFQNCSAYEENNDKALCLGCFRVPSMPSGTYTMEWYWEFNTGEFYTTCFDVQVGGGNGKSAPAKKPAKKSSKKPARKSSKKPAKKSSKKPSTNKKRRRKGGKRTIKVNRGSNKWWISVSVPKARRVQIECGYGYRDTKRNNNNFILANTGKPCTRRTINVKVDGRNYRAKY